MLETKNKFLDLVVLESIMTSLFAEQLIGLTNFFFRPTSDSQVPTAFLVWLNQSSIFCFFTERFL